MQEQPLCWDLRRWGFNIAIQTRNVSSPRWFSEVPYLLHWRLFGATSGRLEAIGQHGSYNIHLFGFWTKVSWLIIFDWDFHGLQKAFCIHWNHLWTNFVVFFFGLQKKIFIKFTRHIISDEDGEPTQMLVWCLDDGTTMSSTATGWRNPRVHLLIRGCECCRSGARQQYCEGLDCSKCLFVSAVVFFKEIHQQADFGWIFLLMFFQDFL